MSNCGKFVALLSVLCSWSLHSAQEGVVVGGDASMTAACVQTFQKLESLRKTSISLNIEGDLGACTPVATWEELIAAIRATASVAPGEGGMPVLLMSNSISAPGDASGKVTIHRPFILAGGEAAGRLHSLEFPLATGLEVRQLLKRTPINGSGRTACSS